MGELAGELVRLGFFLTLWAFGIWIGGTSVAAWVAWEKGRDPVAWFVIGFFLSPLVALVALSAVSAHRLPNRRSVERAAAPRARRLRDPIPAAARLMNGGHTEDKQWDVATSAAATPKRRW